MSTVRETRFIIAREDRAYDPKTVVGDGLRIGRLSDSDVWLNHPLVSRLHAGINKIEGYYYLINLSPSSATTINGRSIPFNEAAALTAGDIVRIGPFFLNVVETDEVFRLSVSLQFGLNVGEGELSHHLTGGLVLPKGIAAASSEAANSLKVFWDKRSREKAGRLSPLHPQTPPRPGKIRFNWIPTRDLVRPWPLAIFIWAAIVVGALSAVAALEYKSAFTPQPLSAPHAKGSFNPATAIAKQTAGGSCTSCHAIGVSMSNRDKMNDNCAACHRTESFLPTVIRAHHEAGISCTTCHTEHQGEGFRPLNAALESCAQCHNDENKSFYRGKSVHTPHSRTYGYGYPVVSGVWVWKGLDAEELAQRPEVVAFLDKNRVTPEQTQQWRNAQFHGIHLDRVRVVQGIDGVDDEDGDSKELSCSSCHKTGYMGTKVDRDYPKKTCARCHNKQVFEKSSDSKAVATPSCTSCHVQHVKDKRWVASRFVAQAETRSSASKK